MTAAASFSTGGFALAGHHSSVSVDLVSRTDSVAGSAADREPAWFLDDGGMAACLRALPGLSNVLAPPKRNGSGSGGGGRG